MAKKKYENWTDEDYESASPAEREKYDALKFDSQSIEENGELSDDDKAAKYFKENENYPHASILQTSDGLFFPDTVKGRNLCYNYQNEQNSKGGEVTVKKYSK